jgi:hypothetical protein
LADRSKRCVEDSKSTKAISTTLNSPNHSPPSSAFNLLFNKPVDSPIQAPLQAILNLIKRDGIKVTNVEGITVRGTAENPIAREEVEMKCRDLIRPILGRGRTEGFIDEMIKSGIWKR